MRKILGFAESFENNAHPAAPDLTSQTVTADLGADQTFRLVVTPKMREICDWRGKRIPTFRRKQPFYLENDRRVAAILLADKQLHFRRIEVHGLIEKAFYLFPVFRCHRSQSRTGP